MDYIAHDLVDNAEKIAQNLFISAPTRTNMGRWQRLNVMMNLMRTCPDIRTIETLYLLGYRQGTGQHAPANGAFYLYADIGAISNDAGDFARRMLHEAGVANPGMILIRIKGRYLRLSYAGGSHTIATAIDRINNWLPAIK